ncbi:MAG: fructosamine kinase family protein [Nitriliruptor sp.]
MSGELPPLPGGLPAVVGADALGGGDVAQVWRAELADGRAAVVKATPYDAELEAEGLRALGDAGAPVPAVLGVDHDVLVLEHVAGPPDWAGLGAALAAVHGHHGEAFGWHRDNVIGPLPQANGWAPPPTFWSAYEEVAPVPEGWEARRAALQLPPLLVHVRLFGAGYLPAVGRALEAAGLG